MIETDRLTIRRFTESDFMDLNEYLSDPLTYVFEPGRPISINQARRLAAKRSKRSDFLGVILKENKKLIGHLYFKKIEPKEFLTWEIGYIFNPAYQGKGYASEASAALVDFAFKHLSVHRIMARCNPENVASWKLLERIGLKREGHFAKYGFTHKDESGNPIWTDAYEYSIVRE